VWEEINRTEPDDLRDFKHGKMALPKTEEYMKILDAEMGKMDIDESTTTTEEPPKSEQSKDEPNVRENGVDVIHENRATFIESPLRPSEKRRVPPYKVLSNLDKLVRSARPRPPNNNRQPPLPPSPPPPRSPPNLL
jgi:hypothetical protein